MNKPNEEMAAFCSSPKCYAPNGVGKGVQKNLPPKTMTCPDCGYVITWFKLKNGRAKHRVASTAHYGGRMSDTFKKQKEKYW